MDGDPSAPRPEEGEVTPGMVGIGGRVLPAEYGGEFPCCHGGVIEPVLDNGVRLHLPHGRRHHFHRLGDTVADEFAGVFVRSLAHLHGNAASVEEIHLEAVQTVRFHDLSDEPGGALAHLRIAGAELAGGFAVVDHAEVLQFLRAAGVESAEPDDDLEPYVVDFLHEGFEVGDFFRVELPGTGVGEPATIDLERLDSEVAALGCEREDEVLALITLDGVPRIERRLPAEAGGVVGEFEFPVIPS